ncbi:MAG: MBL fold metallo-hydrolase [Candidatus Bathyarchaeota archaeon]|jgi:phosphoribosyl 1,2-cyclic phosphodiesterase|nr:MBL fold metallo-hydrolase [Candidatus Bathyarchaeota archaeon A05DMB-5]MDH7558010.1 MBL fold metallo-hydrolase [Candidatus Bathyarchaeota archaeon]
MSSFKIVFLGTGGGRFATITQKRRTAGIRIISDNLNLHLDPGPGALVYSINEGLDPQKINAVFVSHCHPDHYTDAEVLIEAMTRGMTRKRGLLAAANSVLNGSDVCEPSISKYHQQMPGQKIAALPDVKFQVGDVNVLVTEARHTDPDAVGFRFETQEFGDFAYTSDTEYFEGISEYYEGVRLLLLCVMRPAGKPWKGHMTTNDAVKIIEATRPEQAVLTHLGMQMIFKGPANEAKLIKEKTGVPTVAATDGMLIDFGEAINVQAPRKTQQGLNKFF